MISYNYLDTHTVRPESSDNAKIVANYRKRKSLRAKHKAMRQRIADLIREEKQLEHECNEIEGITHVINGVALRIDEWENKARFTVSPIDWDNHRRGYVYLNAHNNTTYGIELQRWEHDRNLHRNLGYDWKSYAKAKKILIDWVTKGIEPNRTGYGWW